jgi:isopenicillin N synthase-like dioxygenase
MSPPQNAVGHPELFIPLIDFSQFTHPDTTSAKATCAAALLDGFKSAGFVYLKNHGISNALVQKAFEHSAAFFARPQEQKDELAWSTPSSNRGYMRLGREKTTTLTNHVEASALRDGKPDMKETMDFGRENVEGLPNQWPEDKFDNEGKGFKRDLYELWTACKALHVEVMRCIGMAMGYDAHFFDEYTAVGDNTLRLLHYPSVKPEAFKTAERSGAHTDFGTISFLFQDDTGGLEVRSPSGVYVPATPIQDTIVVNAGDLLARWSNDLIKSTFHRVVQPQMAAQSATDYCPARYSIAYFCNPDFEKTIEVLPGTWEQSSKGKKYEPIKSGDYLVQRLSVVVAPV